MTTHRSDGPIPDHVLTELAAREPLFHRAEHGTSKADCDALMHPDFWEIGASGRCYTRQYVLDVLDERHREGTTAGEWTIRDFSAERVASAIYLVTYSLDHLGRTTRRSTLWDGSGGVWKVRFHQGTVVG